VKGKPAPKTIARVELRDSERTFFQVAFHQGSNKIAGTPNRIIATSPITRVLPEAERKLMAKQAQINMVAAMATNPQISVFCCLYMISG
jgi:hypothetical protein